MKCKVCRSDTENVFNIAFKKEPICEGCAIAITMQQVEWMVLQLKSPKEKEHRITDHTRRFIFNKTLGHLKEYQLAGENGYLMDTVPADLSKLIWDMLGSVTQPEEKKP